MIVPPLALGALQTSETPPIVNEGTGADGALGEPRNVMDVEGAEATDVPAALVAVTVNV